jgi:mono/diheme cytochrome c family protein
MNTLSSNLVVGSLLLAASLAAARDNGDANDAGRTTFKGACISCHGEDGPGTPLGKSLQAPDLRSKNVQKKSEAELAQTVSEGKGNMPPFKASLSPEQITAVINFVRELGKTGQ